MVTIEVLMRFAATISTRPPALVAYRPELWAKSTQCFHNVSEKVSRDGGSGVTGWIFLPRISPQFGSYLIATHHAVWRAPNGSVIDVTPFHEDPKHQPYSPDGGVLFLWDRAAQPKVVGYQIIPLPSRFFPANDGAGMAAYISELIRDEEAACEKLYYEAVESIDGMSDNGGRR